MLRVSIENARQRLSFDHDGGPLEFGRAGGADGERCVIEDLAVSRNQLRILETPAGVRVENLSGRVPALLPSGRRLEPGELEDLELPTQLMMGATRVRLEWVDDEDPYGDAEDDVYATVAAPVAGESAEFLSLRRRLAATEALDTETLIEWFETVVSVQQAAATSAEFYAITARAVVELVGLDEGLVLLKDDDGQWTMAGRHGMETLDDETYSHRILDFVVQKRRTFFRELSDLSPTASLANVSAAVASPVFGEDRETVVGVVYGRRGLENATHAQPIRPLEAHLVQVLASAVGAGVQRMEKEAEATRWRVQLESFFTPRLVEELDRNPNMLEANERTVTILFADIRGFTDCTARLDAAEALRLVGNVMNHLSTIVDQHDGVIVDYYGDGLMAMWNAPIDQPDHTNRAVNTALDMLAELPRIGDEWANRLGRPLRLGIGINSGSAVVGNVGSDRKFKYGALGLNVNLAQRIETVTKIVGFPALCSGATRESVHTRAKLVRVGRCLLSGAIQPVDLHIVLPKQSTALPQNVIHAHAAALAAFEAGEWTKTVELVEAHAELAALPLGCKLATDATRLCHLGATADEALLDFRTK